MKIVEAIVRFVVGQVMNGMLALLGGLMLMLAVGVAHQHWIHALPTIGYWWAALIVWLLQGAFSTIDMDKVKSS